MCDECYTYATSHRTVGRSDSFADDIIGPGLALSSGEATVAAEKRGADGATDSIADGTNVDDVIGDATSYDDSISLPFASNSTSVLGEPDSNGASDSNDVVPATSSMLEDAPVSQDDTEAESRQRETNHD